MPIKYNLIFSLLLPILFISCEELDLDLDSPFEADPSEQIPEIYNLSYPEINGSSAVFNWESNKFALEFSYKLTSPSYENSISEWSLENIEWSDWGIDTTLTLDDMDEGQYTFHVKSRIDAKEQAEASTVDFEIDAITTPALRIYPLSQQVKVGNAFEVYLYAENIDDLAGSQIKLQFDTDQIEYNESSENCGFESDIFCPQLDDGRITIINWNINGGFNTENPMVQLSFSALNEGVTDILIYSSILRNSLNTDISTNAPINGRIGIVP